MGDFNLGTAGVVFVTYFLIDILYAVYVIYVGKRDAVRSALASSALYSLAAYGVITYSRNIAYVVPLALGAFLGTYVIVKFKK
jgi:small basic protein